MGEKFRVWVRRAFTPGSLYCFPVGVFVYLSFFNVGNIRFWIAEHRTATIAAFVVFFLVVAVVTASRNRKTGRTGANTGGAWVGLGLLLTALTCGCAGLVSFGEAAAGSAIGAGTLLLDFWKGEPAKKEDGAG